MRMMLFTRLAATVMAGAAVAVGAGYSAPVSAGPPPLIVVMMENHGYGGVVGNASMPYLNSLWSEGANGTGPVTDYTAMYAVTHSSLPNYLAITAGSTEGKSGTDAVTAGSIPAQSVWDQLTAAGISWEVYEEGMPTACYAPDSYNDTATDGQYVLGHNPGTIYAPVYSSAECQNDKPLSSLNTGSLPAVAFVTPNLCDDDHGLTSAQLSGLPFQNCQQDTASLLQRGDSWLQAHVSAWTAAGADVLITWDEGTGTAGANGSTGGGRIASLLTGPGVAAGQDSTQYSHYSVLAGIEDAYGLALLGNAASATPLPLPGAASTTPTVSVTSPASGSTVSGTLTVTGTATARGGASISSVAARVDNGTPVSASGTTSWTAGIDTAALANGGHTITVIATDSTGATGSASITVNVANLAATACPATPAGVTELSGNLSVETGQTGWTGVYNANSAITRVQPPSGSYDGNWALQVAPKSGTSGTAGVNNANPLWVPGPPGTATTAGQVYAGSAFVRASTPGEKLSLLVRETTPSGTTIGSHLTTVTLGDTAWHQISSAYTAKGSGDLIRYSLYATNFASPSQNFLADCLSLQTP